MENPDRVLKKYFGFDAFRGTQLEVINQILQRKHVLVIMPTGSGKSLTYQIPALLLKNLTIVISPLIALMQDQVSVLQRRGIDATFINASLTKSEREKRYAQVAEGHFHLLYVTPERFRKPEFVEIILKRNIDLLAVDEAHCISEWGHDFRPDYTRLREFRQLLNNPVTIALTATATPQVQNDIIEQLGLDIGDVRIFHEGIERPNLYLEVILVWGEDEKINQILKILFDNPGCGIIYFVLIRDLNRMGDILQKRGVQHLRYHGDLSADQRRRIQDKFMAGENVIVLATNAFGMGIDKENIRFVIHTQIPSSLETYYQEIGRAGRDGKNSICTLLYDEQDLNIQLEFIKWNNPSQGYYSRLYCLLQSDIQRANAEGMDYLRENLSYKNNRDYRLETALGILDRYGVTEGDIENHTLKLIGQLPHRLEDPVNLEHKKKNEQKKLYELLMYTKEQTCRKAFIHNYFGLPFNSPCGSCDLDSDVKSIK
jgi:ATP-dependent DNA helicase RecQ